MRRPISLLLTLFLTLSMSLFPALLNARAKGTKVSSGEPVRLHWIGNVPEVAKPVSFGIPFEKGELKPTDAFCLTTAEGVEIPADFWPTAYWPDGSVKWGGFAAVVPGGTEQVLFEKKAQKGKGGRSVGGKTANRQPSSVQKGLSAADGQAGLSVAETGQQVCIRSDAFAAYIPKGGTAILDSLVLGGTRVAGCGQLVCTTQNLPYEEGIGNITFQDYVSHIDQVKVERAGKVRAVVKLTGHYRPIPSTSLKGAMASEGQHAASATTLSDGQADEVGQFTVRLYFYAGSEQVRLVHSFVYLGDEHRDFIRSLGVRFEVPMREQAYNRHVAFATQDGGVWSESVQPLSGRRILTKGRDMSFEMQQVQGKRIPEPDAFDVHNQELLHHWAKWNTYRLSQPNDQGYAIAKRAHHNNQWVGTHTGHRACGYAFAGDVSGGLGVSMKDFWQSYPASLQVDSATHEVAYLTAYLWSPDGGPMDLRHYDNVAHDLNASYEDVQEGMSTPVGIARTSVLTLIPESAYPGKAAIAQRARQQEEDAPLVCMPEYLHARRAFGIWSLPDSTTELRARTERQLAAYLDFYAAQQEQHRWYGFWNYGDFMHQYDPARHEWKYDVGGFAWDNTELGSISWLWYSFLRTARPDVWRMAEAMTRHVSEVDVYHAGPFAGLGSRHNVSHWGCGAKEGRISEAAWNRFYYYLTTDERTGDLMSDVKDAEQMLYDIDPMRLALPREKFPCTAPARLRIGPDWVAYVSNWMTEWERTRNPLYLKKITAGMQSISRLPKGFFTGPGVLGYDPKTFELSYEGDTTITSTQHLMLIMGGFEIMNELKEMVPDKTFWDAYLDHNARYYRVTRNSFRIGRLKAYAAHHLQDKALAEETWREMYRTSAQAQHYDFNAYPVAAPEVPSPIIESPFTSTNDAALWSLDAIYMLETIPQ